MRTTLVGTWPTDPRFHADLARYRNGLLDDIAGESHLRQLAAVAIDQQRSCGVNQITGGETSTDSFIQAAIWRQDRLK